MVIDEARNAYKRGWSVIPLHKNSKLPNLNKGHEFLSRKATVEELKGFDFSGNYGVVCGRISGIVVLDVDSPDGDFSLDRFGINPSDYITPTAVSPNGMHYFFKYNSKVRTGVAVLGTGVDIRSDGSYVVGVGSEIENKNYRWSDGWSPEEVELADAPDWMYRNDSVVSVASDISLAEPIKNGRRNNTFTSLAGALVLRDLEPQHILDVLIYFNDTWCDSPLPLDELERIVKSVERYRKD